MLHLSSSSFFFSSTLCFSHFFFTLMPLAYSSTLCYFSLLRPLAIFFFYFFFLFFLLSWPLAIFFFFLNLSASHIFYVACFHKIQQYNTSINASICLSNLFTYWSRWLKRNVNGPKGLIKG